MHTYKIKETHDMTTEVWQFRTDGVMRVISEQHHDYLNWLSLGNTPQSVPYIPPPEPDMETLRSQKLSHIDAAYITCNQADETEAMCYRYDGTSAEISELATQFREYRNASRTEYLNAVDAVKYAGTQEGIAAVTVDFCQFERPGIELADVIAIIGV